jgi:hypothetical protein
MGAGRLPWVAASVSEWARFHSLTLVACRSGFFALLLMSSPGWSS